MCKNFCLLNKFYLIEKNINKYCMAVVSSCFDMYNSVCITNAILQFIKKNQFFFYSKQKSSPHDLSMLGYTRITKIKTKKFNKVIWRDF